MRYELVRNCQSNGIIDQMDSMCSAMLERFNTVEVLCGRFDVLHCHDWHAITALASIKRHLQREYVFTFHSTEWGRNGNWFVMSHEGHEISRRERHAGHEASAVVVTSPSLKQEVLRVYDLSSKKLHIIPNGFFSGKMQQRVDANAVKQRYCISPIAPLVLFVGRMCYQKGPDLLVEATRHVLKERPDVKFIFAGEGDLRANCELRARELIVSDACRFLGYVPDCELANLLNACDLIVVPSRNEPFGVVVLEAWDAGKPVVCTDPVHLVDNFVNGIKARAHPKSIARCIISAIDSPEALCELGAQGKKLINAIYNWDNVSEQTLELYRSIL